MTVRPQTRSGRARESALDYEIAQEQAAALGRLGRALEAALAALASYDCAVGEGHDRVVASAPSGTALRAGLVRDASYALWCLIVQRESCGLRDERLVVREYEVPREVRNCMGAFGGG
jgi:hypothetical protein